LNKERYTRMTRNIPINHGLCVTVDEEDFERLIQFRWIAVWGKVLLILRPVPGGKPVRIAHEILGMPPKTIIRHLNRNVLDNRKENLAIVQEATEPAKERARLCGTPSS
jgi:hypothetical protein